jgi:hypothetical protein
MWQQSTHFETQTIHLITGVGIIASPTKSELFLDYLSEFKLEDNILEWAYAKDVAKEVETKLLSCGVLEPLKPVIF